MLSDKNCSLKGLLKQASHLPEKIGVYLFKDEYKTVLYIGKAKDLKKRVQAYFRGKGHGKTHWMLTKARFLDFILTNSEYEALLLENSLIKQHKPRYNMLLKDGKSYPLVRITQEDYPRLFITRYRVPDKSQYFGPFPWVRSLKDYVKLLHQLYPLRRCKEIPLRKREHPCLYYHMKLCQAPCKAWISVKEYQGYVSELKRFLSGHQKKVQNELKKEMKKQAKILNFEKAGVYKRLWELTQNIEQQQLVEDFSSKAQDFIVGLFLKENALFTVIQKRLGQIVSYEKYPLESYQSHFEALESFVVQYYDQILDYPKEVFVGPLDDVEGAKREFKNRIEEFLRAKSATKVKLCPISGKALREATILKAQDKDKWSLYVRKKWENSRSIAPLSLMALAYENTQAQLQLEHQELFIKNKLKSLQESLHLEHLPLYIEGFDVSHLGGTSTVASLVVFLNGEPDKAQYRRYHIRSVEGIDDYGALKEAVARRYTRLKNEKRKLPDLIFIDGGQGQVNAVLSVLKALELDSIPLYGLAKKEEHLFKPHQSEPIVLEHSDPGLRVLVHVRDETHRFATAFNKRLHGKKLTSSVLEEVEGIGPKRARALLKEFHSLGRIEQASVEQIQAVVKVGAPLIVDLQDYLKTLRLWKQSLKVLR